MALTQYVSTDVAILAALGDFDPRVCRELLKEARVYNRHCECCDRRYMTACLRCIDCNKWTCRERMVYSYKGVDYHDWRDISAYMFEEDGKARCESCAGVKPKESNKITDEPPPYTDPSKVQPFTLVFCDEIAFMKDDDLMKAVIPVGWSGNIIEKPIAQYQPSRTKRRGYFRNNGKCKKK